MLKVPAVAYFEDLRVTAYQDDSVFWKFYLIPDYVSIRRDFNGNPVFLMVKYAFSDEDRATNPDLPAGGGYVAFDVEMAVPEADRAQIIERLQQIVNGDWQRLKEIAESAGQDVGSARVSSWYVHGGHFGAHSLAVSDVRLGLSTESPQAPPSDQPPTVVIAHPTWTEGTFRVSAPQSEELVSHRVTEGPASLIGNNMVAVSMDLTPAGATFMERTLVDIDGSGGTDLTPIQVVYDLKFWARIPPVRLQIGADSRSVYTALTSIEHDYDGHSCSEDDMYHYENHLEMAVQSGLIKVRLDTGTLSLEDDFIQELRGSALKFVQDLMKDSFYEKREAPEAEETPDFVDEEKDIYYLKQISNFESISINYDETLESIVEWRISPQGTLQAFFSGLSASDMKEYVRSIDLDDSFFKSLGLDVTAFADWENEPIAFVEVQVQYSGRDENNQVVEKVENFTFTKEGNTGSWDPSLIGTKREYSYRWRVGFEGREPGEFTRWERDSTPHLNLSIADPGKIAVRVLAGSIDFAQTVDQVQLELSYTDPGSDVEEAATTLLLTDGQQEQNFERYIFAEWDRPVRYRTHFFLKDGQKIESDWQETLNRQLLINAPLYDKLDVRLVPAGDWEGVTQSVVSLRYEDEANDYHTDGAFVLKTADEFKAWAVVLSDPGHREFQYKVLTTFDDGSHTETDWLQADGDQALPIVVQRSPRLQTVLLPQLLDFSVTPVVEVTLRYDDPEGDIQEVETFTFTEPEGAVRWNIPVADEDRNTYRYEITYHTADGQAIELAEEATDATSLAIQKLIVPEIVGTVVPKLIDFAETPVVEVNVEYSDPEHDIEFTDTLVFTEKADQTFRIQVRDDSPRSYRLSVTYYLASGEVVESEPADLKKKRVVLRKFVANGQG